MDQNLYIEMVSLREHIKLLHFQTTNYALHKATDQFLETYDDLFDTFWETKQASKFRVLLTNASLTLNNVRTYNELQPLIKTVEKLLLKESDPAVATSRDSLLEAVAQFSYLITFN
jgi:hypothetical protein